jgi:hypothetical protein
MDLIGYAVTVTNTIHCPVSFAEVCYDEVLTSAKIFLIRFSR